MQITLKLYASLADYLPPGSSNNRAEVEVGENDSVADIVERFHLPEKWVKLVLVNGVYLDPEQRQTRRFVAGDHLAIWPPIAGG